MVDNMLGKASVIFGMVLVFVSLAAGAADINLGSSASVASITSYNTGTVYFYAENLGDESGSVALSANAEHLTAYFDAAYLNLPAHSVKGSNMHFSAPDCFRGDEIITVYAQFCTEKECTVKEKKLRVSVTPAEHCDYYIEGFAENENYVPGYSCNADGCFKIGANSRPVDSTITSTTSFSRTDYEARIKGGETCEKVLRGGNAGINMQITNRGPAATFYLRLVGDSSILNADINREYVSLQMHEQTDVTAYFYPSDELGAGRYFATLQVLFNDQLIAEKDACIDLYDSFETIVNAPKEVELRRGRNALIIAEITNRGTGRQDYSVEVQSIGNAVQAVQLAERFFSLEAGEEKQLALQVDPSQLKLGSNSITLIVQSEDSTVRNIINLELSDENIGSEVGEAEERGAAELKFTLAITNEEDYAIENVELEVSGVPEEWEVQVEENGFTLPANSEKKVGITIRATTAEEAEPIVTISSNGRVLSVQRLPKMQGEDSSMTGFLVLTISNNLPLIIAIIVIAVLVILMFARSGEPDYAYRHRYAGKLEEMKEKAAQ